MNIESMTGREPSAPTGEEMLRKVDWNLSEARGSEGVHALHPYPAKFVPEIPRRLLELFPPKASEAMLDPFCGSGTALVEALDTGIDAIGVDVNPLACLISRVKTRPLPSDFDHASSEVFRLARLRLRRNGLEIPKIPNLDHWFAPIVQRELAAIVSEINSVESLESREALQVALSRIVVGVSFQESDTRYAAIHKKFSKEDVLAAFRRSTNFVKKRLSGASQSKLFGRRGEPLILNRDVLTLEPLDIPKRIGIVITSPPYPNAYEYWLYHKYRMYWLGMDPIRAKESEIGARPRYFKTKSEDETDFERQMSQCFSLIASVMDPHAKACFVISNSTIHGKVIDNVALLTRAARGNFSRVGVVPRRILTHRRSFNVRRNREEEYVMVLERV
jgi:site-specific DNA-methyltransferase (cytosine-N4-specific)